MLQYQVDTERLTIEEVRTGQDVEVWLRLSRPDAEVEKAVKKIRAHFEENDLMTDILFYPHHNYEYQWIVSHDFYEEFILRLFKHRLLNAIHWADLSGQ